MFLTGLFLQVCTVARPSVLDSPTWIAESSSPTFPLPNRKVASVRVAHSPGVFTVVTRISNWNSET